MEKKTSYLFDFQAYIEELRANEKKKKIVEDYEEIVLNGKRIEGDIQDQIWYKEYLSKFTPVPKYLLPENLKDDFDWKILFQLIASSPSCEYWLEYPEIDSSTHQELVISVENNKQTIKKCISELWSFQIIRLFEIYCEEQINYEVLLREEKEEDGIKKIRNKRLKRFEDIKKPKLPPKNKDKKPKNNVACFYCSLEAAKKILENGYIFASDMSYMNDKEELSFGVDILIKAFERINQTTKNAKLKKILNEIINNPDNVRKIKNDLTKDFVFISCFSRKADKLSQWRAYGDNGYGVCLVFDFDITKGDSKSDKFWMDDVKYIRKEEKMISKEWKEILRFVEDNMVNSIKSISQISNEPADVIDYIPSELKREIPFWKNKEFKEEEEFRNVCLYKEVQDLQKYPINFRVDKTFIIPYIKLLYNSEKNETSLIEIVVGPSVPDFEKTKKSLVCFLEKLSSDKKIDYDKIIKGRKIRKSIIPYIP